MSRLLPFVLAASFAYVAGPPTSGRQESGELLEDVFARVRTSVVTLRTTSRTGPADQGGHFTSSSGVGSGVLIGADGRILTAAHVVQTADRVIVEFADGVRKKARVLSSEPKADVALVELEEAIPPGVAIAPLADSDQTRVGSRVFVVGAPLGISHTLTVGYVSARRRSPIRLAGLRETEHFQTDAAINEGNSGGPMFNMRGEVVGIVSYIVSQSGGSDGLGFAVTANVARELMLERPPFWSGVEGVLLSADLAAAFNLPEGAAGLLVQRVAKNSFAERIGLHGGTVEAKIRGDELLIGGDVVLAVMGVPFAAPDFHEQVAKLVGEIRGKGEVEILVLRAGKTIELSGPLSP